MNTFGSTKSNGATRRNIIGLFEDDFEKETSLVSTIASTVASVAKVMAKDLAGGVYEATADLSQTVVIAETKTETRTNGKFSMDASIDFRNQAKKLEETQKKLEQSQKDQKEASRKKDFFQTLKEDTDRAKREKEEELLKEINDIALNLPTDQKNQILHYQASYRDRSIYQLAELRKTLIEQKKKEEKQQKAASIPSPAKQPSAMEGAFEGGSGTQGGGTANLSAQAVG